MQHAEPELTRVVEADSAAANGALKAPALTRAVAKETPTKAATAKATVAAAPSRSIGEFIRRARHLSDVQVEQILLYQREHDVRFGEAAVALQLASREDVAKALSVQFHYPYGAAREYSLNPDLVVAATPFGPQAEVFRDLRGQLLSGVLSPDLPRSALAVLSAAPGDGKTYVAANLAISLSQLGLRTLVVDANLRTPRMHTLFGIRPRSGLSGVLAGLAESDVIHEVPGLPSLYVMPVGAVPPNPNELVANSAFTLLLNDLFERFDHVIVDTPAAVCGADARTVAMKCGASIVVGRRHASAIKSMRALLDSLAKTSTRLAGVLINEH